MPGSLHWFSWVGEFYFQNCSHKARLYSELEEPPRITQLLDDCFSPKLKIKSSPTIICFKQNTKILLKFPWGFTGPSLQLSLMSELLSHLPSSPRCHQPHGWAGRGSHTKSELKPQSYPLYQGMQWTAAVQGGGQAEITEFCARTPPAPRGLLQSPLLLQSVQGSHGKQTLRDKEYVKAMKNLDQVSLWANQCRD